MLGTDKTATWIGGGAVAAVTVPVFASLCLGLARASGLPVGNLAQFPTPMIVLWAPVFGVVIAAPVAFVLGAWAVRSAQRLEASARQRTTIQWCSLIVAVGGGSWGAVLSQVDIAGLHVGWMLIPVGLCAGAITGGLVGWIASSDRGNAAHAD